MTGWPPNCSGPGMPQRAMTSSRSSSALLRTIGVSCFDSSLGGAPVQLVEVVSISRSEVKANVTLTFGLGLLDVPVSSSL